jgi:lipoprotein Spr
MFYFKSKVNVIFILTILFSITLLYSCKSTKNTSENASSYAAKKLQNKYAAVLAVNPESIKNIKLYQFVDEWIGVPYKYGGKTKDGIDCSDFTSVLCKTVYNKTVEVPATKIYSVCKPISMNEIQEGDLIFFKIESEKISHVGVYLQNNKFIHASTKKGVIINDLNEAYYKKYFYKAARIK